MQVNNRAGYVENLRGLAIIIVVLGHSIILYSSGWNLYTIVNDVPFLDSIKSVINIIQMPLFFSLSGFCFRYTLRKDLTLSELFRSKVNRLLIPFLAISLLWMLPIRIAIRYPQWTGHGITKIIFFDIILGRDCGHLWYLPTLFMCFLVAYALRRVLERNSAMNKKARLIIWCCVLLSSRFYFLFMTFPFLGWTIQYFVYFYTGYILFDCIDMLRGMKYTLKMIAFVVSVISAAGALKTGSTFFTTCAALVALVTVYAMIPDTKSAMFSKIAENSFGIYLLHSPLIYITYTFLNDANPFVVVGINFIVFGFVAYILTVCIRRTPFKILLGD